MVDFESIKKGALHRQLGIPKNKKIPKTLLKAIVRAPVGKTISNPTSTGPSRIKVTRKLKQRALFALNFGYKD